LKIHYFSSPYVTHLRNKKCGYTDTVVPVFPLVYIKGIPFLNFFSYFILILIFNFIIVLWSLCHFFILLLTALDLFFLFYLYLIIYCIDLFWLFGHFIISKINKIIFYLFYLLLFNGRVERLMSYFFILKIFFSNK